MNGDRRPRYGRQRRGGRACDGMGPGRGRGAVNGTVFGRRGEGASSSERSLAGRTTGRALLALGAYVAQDLRDAEGLTRPMLRRGALRLTLSRREGLRRLASSYLRLDPPTPDELQGREVIDVGGHALRALPEAPSGPGDADDVAERQRPAC
jgi:hypothetical protein